MTHDHLSYSQISAYLACPLRYKFQYVDGVPPAFTSAPFAFGVAIHEAAAAFYQTRLEGEQLRPDEMVDVYADCWRRQERVRFFNGDSERSLMEKAKLILSVFHECFDPSVSILGVEEFFELPIGGLPPFQGYIDLIEQSAGGQITIVDLKTASKKLPEANVHTNLQLTAYSLGAAALGFDARAMNLRLDVLLKTRSPEMLRYETTRSDDDRHRFVKTLHGVWHGIHKNIWFPREDWHCAQCAWSTSCPEW